TAYSWHIILKKYRDSERTSTVVINAYLVPLMSKYLRALAEELKSVACSPSSVVSNFQKSDKSTNHGPRTTDYGLRVMQSNGGSGSSAAAAPAPIRAILLRRAGGVFGALRA